MTDFNYDIKTAVKPFANKPQTNGTVLEVEAILKGLCVKWANEGHYVDHKHFTVTLNNLTKTIDISYDPTKYDKPMAWKKGNVK